MAGAARNPDATAILTDGRELTYRELDARSNQLARVLIEYGAGPETAVAMAIPRSIESVLATWAIAKTGAAFVPVDPGYPAERITHMISDSGTVAGVTTAMSRETLPGERDWLLLDDAMVTARIAAMSDAPVTDADRHTALRVANVAYVIYTSGSTGLPKGVQVTHAGRPIWSRPRCPRSGSPSARGSRTPGHRVSTRRSRSCCARSPPARPR